jgi:chromosome segregation ATPase
MALNKMIQRIKENIKNEEKEVKFKLKGNKYMEEEYELYKKEKEDLICKQNKLNEQKKETDKDKNKIEEEIKDIEKILEENKDIIIEKQKNEKELKKLDLEENKLRININKLDKKIKSSLKDNELFEKYVNKIEESKVSSKEKIKELEKEIKFIKKKIDNINIIKKYETLIENYSEEKEQLINSIFELKNELNEKSEICHKNEIELKKINAEKNLDKDTLIINKYKTEIKIVNNEIKSFKNNIENLKTENKKLNEMKKNKSLKIK